MGSTRSWRAAMLAVAAAPVASCTRAGYHEPVPAVDLAGADSAFGFGDGPRDTTVPTADLLLLVDGAPDRAPPADLLPLPSDLLPVDTTVSPDWEPLSFVGQPVNSPCTGARWVKFLPSYGLWVGAILCSPQRYKLMLAASRTAQYHEIGDCSGHGQDQCELVNPGFTLPISDDITSGCPTCDIESIGSIGGTAGFHRCNLGEPFTFSTAMTTGQHSYAWIECAVTIPKDTQP